MNNDLNQIRIFCQVAQLQSFTQAAHSLDIEKSTVSNKISQLEQRLGVKLLQRTTRSVTVTEAGEQYLAFCLAALDKLEDGENLINEIKKQVIGHIRIAVPQNFADFIMPRVLTPLLNEHPRLTIQVEQGLQQFDLVKDGFDLAVVASFKEIEDSSLVYRKIYQSERIFVASAAYVEKYGIAQDMQSLTAQPYIGSFVAGTQKESFNQVYSDGKWHTLKARLSINSTIAITKAVDDGLGFAIMPTGMVQAKLESGELVQLAKEVKLTDSEIYLVYPSRLGQPAKLKVVIDSLVEWGESTKKSA